ncbi:MAG TPA: AAA family ATPase [Jatrophihabitans sp.]|nr:AAA family ATPase [Jatrophihabitans sp.]
MDATTSRLDRARRLLDRLRARPGRLARPARSAVAQRGVTRSNTAAAGTAAPDLPAWELDTLRRARRLARRRGHAQVTMQHVALVLAEEDPEVVRQWRALGIDVERTRRELAPPGVPESARYGRNYQFHAEASDDIVIEPAVAEFFRECKSLPVDAGGRPAGAELAGAVLTQLSAPLPGSSLLAEPPRRGSTPSSPAEAAAVASVRVRRSDTAADRRTDADAAALDTFGRDLTQLAAMGRLDPLIDRDDEVAAVLRVLRRRAKRNPLLVGEPGVGKTAIVEGVAQRVVAGALDDTRLISLDLAGLLAGTRYRGEFEERVQDVLTDALHASTPTILFIDEFHLVARTGAAEGGLDLGSILLAPMARGHISVIGATTPDDYRRHLRYAGPLLRRVQVIEVREPTAAQAVAIVRGVGAQYEGFHGVEIDTSAYRTAVSLGARLPGRLPDAALDLIDDACAQVRLHAKSGAPVRVLARDVEAIAATRPSARQRRWPRGLTRGRP